MDITPLPRYYGPIQLPLQPIAGYVFSDNVGDAQPSLQRASQVPWLIFQCVLSPTIPGNSADAYAYYFSADSRLHHSRKDGRYHIHFFEAESSSLTLRLTSSMSRGQPPPAITRWSSGPSPACFRHPVTRIAEAASICRIGN